MEPETSRVSAAPVTVTVVAVSRASGALIVCEPLLSLIAAVVVEFM